MDRPSSPPKSQQGNHSSPEEPTIYYIDDMSTGLSPPQRQHSHSATQLYDLSPTYGSYQQPDITLASRPRPHHHQQQRRRNSSVSSQCGNGLISNAGRPRRQRRQSEFVDTSHRRMSTAQGRTRANSYTRATPLGDGRRASVCRKSSNPHSNPNRRRLSSSAHRRDSIRPASVRSGSRSPSMLLTPTSCEARMMPCVIKDPRELARARRHRLVAFVLLAVFVFILVAAVLAVVITLTHSSFHAPPVGSRELAEHRANEAVNPQNSTSTLRKENEELLNSLNRAANNNSVAAAATTLQPT